VIESSAPNDADASPLRYEKRDIPVSGAQRDPQKNCCSPPSNEYPEAWSPLSLPPRQQPDRSSGWARNAHPSHRHGQDHTPLHKSPLHLWQDIQNQQTKYWALPTSFKSSFLQIIPYPNSGTRTHPKIKKGATPIPQKQTFKNMIYFLTQYIKEGKRQCQQNQEKNWHKNAP
jgi:hypothetical protein